MKEIGLYIHIPYCKSKCLYCDFNSYADKCNSIEKYVAALIKEIELYQSRNDYKYKTVFFGGGTPTFIHYAYIGKIMNKISHRLTENAEISLECNPGTADDVSLENYREIGINRLSIGLQAWQDELLHKIGRIHSCKEFIETYEAARKAGFTNISVDLMFALPNQTPKMWMETLHNISKLGLEHISCYSLKLEEETKLYDMYNNNQIELVDEDTDRLMYHTAIEFLEGYNYKQYEISNFAKPGKECRHNLLYWHNEEYLGVGAGSHSKLSNIRFWNYRAIDKYVECLDNNIVPIEDKETIDVETDMWESIFLALRLNEGLKISRFNEKYNVSFLEKYAVVISDLINKELITADEKTVKLTTKGVDLSNQVFMAFMD